MSLACLKCFKKSLQNFGKVQTVDILILQNIDQYGSHISFFSTYHIIVVVIVVVIIVVVVILVGVDIICSIYY